MQLYSIGRGAAIGLEILYKLRQFIIKNKFPQAVLPKCSGYI
jgi:hypothetical protein